MLTELPVYGAAHLPMLWGHAGLGFEVGNEMFPSSLVALRLRVVLDTQVGTELKPRALVRRNLA